MNILVTGATSMIAVSLIKKLIKKDIEIIALVRSKTKNIYRLPPSEKIKIIKCDLENLKKTTIKKPIDVAFHFAWSNTGKDRDKNFNNQISNISDTINLIRILSYCGCKKIIAAGSQAEYGINNKNLILNEKSVINPKTPYGICKNIANVLGRIEAKKLNIEFIWVRIFSVYGNNDRKDSLIMSAIKNALNNQNIYLNSCDSMWEYIYVDDVAYIFEMILENDLNDPIYNISSPEKDRIENYVRKIIKVLKSKSKIICNMKEKNTNHNLNSDINLLRKRFNNIEFTNFDKGIKKLIHKLK